MSGRSRSRGPGPGPGSVPVPPGQTQSSGQSQQKHKNRQQEIMQSKYAGISPESVQCVADQVMTEQLTPEACAALAEDVTYKLRQLIHNVALHAQHTRRERIDVDDVNTVLRLMDVEPVIGAQLAQWVPLGDPDNLCVPVDPVVDVLTVATQQQSFYTVQPPSLSACWTLENKYKTENTEISSTLKNYFSKICKAILSGDKRLSKVALNDIKSNTRIGLIIPNFFNLAVLILSEECMSVMAPDTHQALQVQALNLLEYLFVNPCCYDTNVSPQLQRLFTILISNVLTESILSEKMCRIMNSICTIWPQFAHIGRTIILEYLAQGIQERLSSNLVACLAAMGRKALIDGLFTHLEMIESVIYGNITNVFCPGLYEAVLDSSHIFLGGKLVKYSTNVAYIDHVLYEILGDSVLPRRYQTLIEKKEEPSLILTTDMDCSPHSPIRTVKKSKVRIIKSFSIKHESNGIFFDNIFDTTDVNSLRKPDIIFSFAGCQQLEPYNKNKLLRNSPLYDSFSNGGIYSTDRKVNIPIANGLLNRFKYKLPYVRKPPPNLLFYTI